MEDNNVQELAPEVAIRLPDASKFVVSSSPHLHERSPQVASVKRIMITVIIALLPACGAGIYFFGIPALAILCVSVGSCVFFEWLWNKIACKPTTIGDYSAIVSGLLLGMNLSANLPLWLVVIGALVTITIGKMLYGGLGYNPFNPAIVGRIFMLLSFTGYMTTWETPAPLGSGAIATTTATPLAIPAVQMTEAPVPYLDYFLGNMPGCLGETSALAILIGGIFLIALNLIKWQVPLTYLGTIALFSAIIWQFAPESTPVNPNPLFQLLTGGAMLAAFFMCTDMVTTPITIRGGIIFAAGAGLITVIIRFWGAYPEGASFSILLMNALTPLIDRYTNLKPFGYRKPQSVPAAGGVK